jgi:predicted RNA-binding protein with TRAM domain
MVEIPTRLQTLFTSSIEVFEDRYFIEVPRSEIDSDTLDPVETYRIAFLSADSAKSGSSHIQTPSTGSEPRGYNPDRWNDSQQPPVKDDQIIDVKIESLGDQGDGIAKVGTSGYVVVVPDTVPGNTYTIQIDSTKENVAFAEVVN